MKQNKKHFFIILLCILTVSTCPLVVHAENESSVEESVSVADESSVDENSAEETSSDESSFVQDSSNEESYPESSYEEPSYEESQESTENWNESSQESTEPNYTESSVEEPSYEEWSTESSSEESVEVSDEVSEESTGLTVFENEPLKGLKSLNTIIPADNSDYIPPAERSTETSVAQRENTINPPPGISDSVISKSDNHSNPSSFILGVVIWFIIAAVFIATAIVLFHSKTPKFNPTRTYFRRKKKVYKTKSYKQKSFKKTTSVRYKKYPSGKSYHKYKSKR